MSYRDQGKSALSTVLGKEQNIRIIEKYVNNLSVTQAKSDDNLENVYKRNIYQAVGDVLSGKKLKALLDSVKSGKMGWSHTCFKEMQNRMNEQDDFIENPFDVEEGVLQCKSIVKKTGKMCNSRRVFSYSKQCRGSDEPMSTFATCCACGSKWTYSG